MYRVLVYINRNKNNSPMRYFKARCPHCKTKFIFDLNDIRPYIDTVGTSVKCRICHKYIGWGYNCHEISERKFRNMVKKYDTDSINVHDDEHKSQIGEFIFITLISTISVIMVIFIACLIINDI